MRLNWFVKSSAAPSGGRRVLRAIGQTWHASPFRRGVQALFFLLFLTLFFYVAWPYGGGDFAQVRQRKEIINSEFFLALDPLVSISAAIVHRAWVWSLSFAGVILVISVLVPRVFCGYFCPMGTMIDLFDWAVSNRIKWFRIHRPGWWRHLRYFVLIAVLVAACGGVMLSGYVAPIPVLTRGLQFMASPVQTGMARGWNQVTPLNIWQMVSIGLFVLVLMLGLLRSRFWCRYLCPTGAIFSLTNFLRLSERKVSSACIECGKCSKVCHFDGINDDYSTIGANCAFCQTCGGVCPVGAISFAGRLTSVTVAGSAIIPAINVDLRPSKPTRGFSRRGFISGMAGAAVCGGLAAVGVRATHAKVLTPLLRPPGSLPEDAFLSLCVRCGECLRVCPGNLLQPVGLDQGLDRLWTPWANTDFAGCEPTCNNCGQVCPTGAIKALTLVAKKKSRMGLVELDEGVCRQCQDGHDCEITGSDGNPSLICREVCLLAGYEAITFKRGASGLMPSVVEEQCVGCGLCQARCFRVNVAEKKLLIKPALRVQAGLELPVLVQRGAEKPPSTAPSTTMDVPYSPDNTIELETAKPTPPYATTGRVGQ